MIRGCVRPPKIETLGGVMHQLENAKLIVRHLPLDEKEVPRRCWSEHRHAAKSRPVVSRAGPRSSVYDRVHTYRHASMDMCMDIYMDTLMDT